MCVSFPVEGVNLGAQLLLRLLKPRAKSTPALPAGSFVPCTCPSYPQGGTCGMWMGLCGPALVQLDTAGPKTLPFACLATQMGAFLLRC